MFSESLPTSKEPFVAEGEKARRNTVGYTHRSATPTAVDTPAMHPHVSHRHVPKSN